MRENHLDGTIFSHARNIEILDLELLGQIVDLRHLVAISHSIHDQLWSASSPRILNLFYLLNFLHFYNIV
jgi:hypothetical protein